MNKWLMFSLVLGVIMGCSKEQKLSVIVKNPIELNRNKETVEIGWEVLHAQLIDATDSNVVVYDARGQEVPSQVLYKGGKKPVSLIFQVSVQPSAEAAYTIKTGKPAVYKREAYGRFVPERMDDYAWENNLVGHRMYGPALEATGEISNGIDTWVKSTDELLIDEWYKTGDYHKDHGKGMDCYKVGRTLGSGALAPWIEGKMVLANNYIHQQTLDNGPIRISFRLDYAPFQAGEVELTESRTITLDANSRFNRIEDVYIGSSADMEVVAGIVMRPAPGDTLQSVEEGVAAYWEPQNNDNGDNNGHLGVGMVFPSRVKDVFTQDGHLLVLSDYKAGRPFIYYMGTAWSKGGVSSAAEWFKQVREESIKVKNPLAIKIVKE